MHDNNPIPTSTPAKVTLKHLQKLKGIRPFSALTAYDATITRACSNAGVDVILVGDSLGNVIQGKKTTVPVTMEHMLYHTHCVTNAGPRSLIMVDMPFASYGTLELGVHNASELMRAGAELVKVEFNDRVPDLVLSLRQVGIPSCVHLGLLPQSYFIDGYSVHGKNDTDAKRLIDNAQRSFEAGAVCLLLECVPRTVAHTIAREIPIPVIGIGAGPDVDGQILVCYDMLGLGSSPPPRFVRNFMHEQPSIEAAFRCYVHEVEKRLFPANEQCY